MSDTVHHFDYAMPSLGSDMEQGSIIEWLVAVGDVVERGQVVARIETEKSDIDIEIWQPGVVDDVLVEVGMTVPVGAPLLALHSRSATTQRATSTDAGPAPASEREAAPEPVDIDALLRDVGLDDVGPGGEASDVEDPSEPIRATPLARRTASHHGIALADVVGSGPSGAVRVSDLSTPTVEARAERSDAERSDAGGSVERRNEKRTRAERMRSMIGVRMARSNREIPHYRLQRDIHLKRLVDHLAAINADRAISERIVPAAALVHAVAAAAKSHPELNGTWSDDRFHPGLGVNLSVAISLRNGGLVTPTIRNADTISLEETMGLLREFTTEARRGRMRAGWTAVASSITVTNLGERGADLVHGLISPPEVALVGFGRIIERPTVAEGAIVIHPVVTATLAADHRATDGAVGSRFLATLADTLEHPEPA